ncbi:MAG: hypothetical protein DMF95_26620 [Acidobacteria bacterium]|nr:MAG: hypothetical protein DMF95_26620 [Acidobacteriota bacterium]
MRKHVEKVVRERLKQKNTVRNVQLFVLFLLAVAAAVPLSVIAQQAYPPNGSTFPTVTLNGSPATQQPAPNPPNQQSNWNTQLAGHDDLQGRSAYQPLIINENGREIAYVGHHTGSAMNSLTGKVEPNGTSIVDVTDVAHPRYLAHIPGSSEGGEEGGGAQMVRVCSGSVLPHGVRGKWYLLRPNGSVSHEIYDVTDPAHPARLTTVVEGLTGTHKSWWECDTGIAYLVGNSRPEGWTGGNHMKIYDLSDPAKPVYIRDFGLLGSQPGATSHEGLGNATGIHGPISAGPGKNRVYAAYGTGANGVIQILDRQKLLTAFKNPLKPTTEEMLAPQVGFVVMSPDQGAHTTFPVYGQPVPEFQGYTGKESLRKRDLLIVPSEASRGDHCAPGPGRGGGGGGAAAREDRPAPHLAFLVDITSEVAPWNIATFRVPDADFCGKGGRFGAHASTESFYPPYYGKLAIFSWFNAGTRVFDMRDPFAVQEVAYFIPAPNKNTMAFCADGVSHPAGDPKITPACTKVIQTNNVELDDRGLIYSADRAGTGLHIIRLTGHAAEVAAR